MTKERLTLGLVLLTSGAALFGFGCLIGRSTVVPLPTRFWEIAAQPAATMLAAASALIVGGLAFYGVHIASARARESEARALSQKKEEAQAQRCWSRFEWMVERIEDDSVPPAVLTSFVVSLVTDAKNANDATLLTAASEYADLLSDAFAGPISL